MNLDLVAGALAGVGGMAGVWAGMRFVAPLVGDLVSDIFKLNRDLDTDRERVISSLREEVKDYERREQDLEERLTAAREDAKAARAECAEAQRFIATYIRTRPPRG